MNKGAEMLGYISRIALNKVLGEAQFPGEFLRGTFRRRFLSRGYRRPSCNPLF
jgi:hypothetical protein